MSSHAKLDRACAAAYTEATPSFVMPQSASLAGRVTASGEEPLAIRSLPVAGQDGESFGKLTAGACTPG